VQSQKGAASYRGPKSRPVPKRIRLNRRVAPGALQQACGGEWRSGGKKRVRTAEPALRASKKTGRHGRFGRKLNAAGFGTADLVGNLTRLP